MKSSNKGKDFCVFALPGLFCFLAVVMVPFIYGIYLTLTLSLIHISEPTRP